MGALHENGQILYKKWVLDAWKKGQNSRDMMKRKNTLHSLSVKRNKRIGGRGLVGNEIKTSYIVEMRSRPRI